MERIPQSTAIRVELQAYLASDHVTPATGKTIAITISKNGAAYGNPNAGATNATEIGSGSYYVDLDTTDSGTLGPLWTKGAEGTIDTIINIKRVVAATNAGFTALPAVAAGANGGVPLVGTQVPNATAGAANGLVTCGSNAATTFASLTVTAALTLGSLTNNGTTTLTGNVTLSGTLGVGAVTLNALTVTTTTTLTGNVSLGGTLGVTGTTTFAAVTTTGTVTMNALTVSNATTLTGNVSLGGSLAVTGVFSATNAGNDIRGILTQPAISATLTELAGVPNTAATTAGALIMWLGMGTVNERTTTAADDTVANAADVVIGTAPVSDDTVTFVREKYA